MTSMIRKLMGMGKSLVTQRAALVVASVVGLGALSASQASARDHGFVDVVVPVPVPVVTQTSQVWVEPVYQTVVNHVWVEPVYQTAVVGHQFVPERMEVRDMVHPNRPWLVDRQSVVVPGHYEDVTQQVVLTPGHYEDVQQQVLVTPGHWEATGCVSTATTIFPEIGFDFIFGGHHWDHDHHWR